MIYLALGTYLKQYSNISPIALRTTANINGRAPLPIASEIRPQIIPNNNKHAGFFIFVKKSIKGIPHTRPLIRERMAIAGGKYPKQMLAKKAT
jgi:hypothetical protein